MAAGFSALGTAGSALAAPCGYGSYPPCVATIVVPGAHTTNGKAPTVTVSVTPARGGAQVVITGSNISGVPAGSKVTISTSNPTAPVVVTTPSGAKTVLTGAAATAVRSAISNAAQAGAAASLATQAAQKCGSATTAKCAGLYARASALQKAAAAAAGKVAVVTARELAVTRLHGVPSTGGGGTFHLPAATTVRAPNGAALPNNGQVVTTLANTVVAASPAGKVTQLPKTGGATPGMPVNGLAGLLGLVLLLAGLGVRRVLR